MPFTDTDRTVVASAGGKIYARAKAARLMTAGAGWLLDHEQPCATGLHCAIEAFVELARLEQMDPADISAILRQGADEIDREWGEG